MRILCVFVHTKANPDIFDWYWQILMDLPQNKIQIDFFLVKKCETKLKIAAISRRIKEFVILQFSLNAPSQYFCLPFQLTIFFSSFHVQQFQISVRMTIISQIYRSCKSRAGISLVVLWLGYLFEKKLPNLTTSW